MDSIIMDPELTSEMVKLLAQELKVVRAQLREAERRTSAPCTDGPSNKLTHGRTQALVAENSSLRADNAALQETVARLQDELRHVSSIKSEEDGEMPISHAREELARLRAENEELGEASRNQEKLPILQEKYKRKKAQVYEYNEILNELRVSLSNCTQELEQSRQAVISEVDFRDFLNDVPYEPVEGQLELSSIASYTRPHKFRKDILDVCNGPYFINYNEVIWSTSGIALGLVVKPTFRYNPKVHGGIWSKCEDGFENGRRMDVCCFSGKTARYLGTYERVETKSKLVIAPETLQYMDHEKLGFISTCTTLFPDLVPPSQTQMIKNMYKQGVIKLQCFGIRCVAFNQTLAGKLQEMSTSSSMQQNLSDGNIPTPSIDSRDVQKRKRNSKSVVHSNRNKKKYAPFVFAA